MQSPHGTNPAATAAERIASALVEFVGLQRAPIPAIMPAAPIAAPLAEPDLLLTSREASRMLRISEKTLFNATKRGDIPVVRIGRSVRYDPADLKRWIEENKRAGKNVGASK